MTIKNNTKKKSYLGEIYELNNRNEQVVLSELITLSEIKIKEIIKIHQERRKSGKAESIRYLFETRNMNKIEELTISEKYKKWIDLEEEETEERIGRLNDLFNMIEQMDNLHLTDENTQESPNLG